MCRKFFFMCFALSFFTMGLSEAFSDGAHFSQGVVDQMKIASDSKAMKQIQSVISEKRNLYQKQILEQEKMIRAEHEKLMADQKKMPKKNFDIQQASLQAKVEKIRKHVEALRAQLEKAQNQAMSTFHATLQDVVKKVALEKGMNQVLPAGTCIWFDPAMDITQRVVELLNTQLPKVDVSFASEDSNAFDMKNGPQHKKTPEGGKK